MNKNEQLIHDFYNGFKQLDWQLMSACYHADITFSDPVFTYLQGEEVGGMWRMLCTKAEDFELSFDQVKADEIHGSARWQATYTFSKTGRKVHNVIFAEFQFSEGKIIRHSDHFSFWRWSKMALGPMGMLLGWSGYLRRKVQLQALLGLRLFLKRN